MVKGHKTISHSHPILKQKQPLGCRPKKISNEKPRISKVLTANATKYTQQ